MRTRSPERITEPSTTASTFSAFAIWGIGGRCSPLYCITELREITRKIEFSVTPRKLLFRRAVGGRPRDIDSVQLVASGARRRRSVCGLLRGGRPIKIDPLAKTRSAIGLLVACVLIGGMSSVCLARTSPQVRRPLLELATTRFSDLTPAERALLLFADLKNGAPGDFAVAGVIATPTDPSNEPVHADEWNHDREV
jgi:hypothetical protein